MWSEENEAVAIKRMEEREMDNDFWGKMAGRGAKVVRHENNATSAHSIIRRLLQYKTPVTLQLQAELDEHNGELSRTAAGKQLDANLSDTLQDLSKQIRDLQDEIRDLKSSNESAQSELEELRELNQHHQDVENQKSRLRRLKVSLRFLLTPLLHHVDFLKVIVKPEVVSAVAGTAAVVIAAATACSIL